MLEAPGLGLMDPKNKDGKSEDRSSPMPGRITPNSVGDMKASQ